MCVCFDACVSSRIVCIYNLRYKKCVCVRAYVCVLVHVHVTIQNITDLLWSLQEILRYTQDRVRRDIQYYRQSTWKMYSRHVHTHAHTHAYWNNVYAKIHTHTHTHTHTRQGRDQLYTLLFYSCKSSTKHTHTYTFIQYKPHTHKRPRTLSLALPPNHFLAPAFTCTYYSLTCSHQFSDTTRYRA